MGRGTTAAATVTRSKGESKDGEEPFYVGVAISTWQSSGDPNTNWGAWERGRNAFGLCPIKNHHRCGSSCDFWELFREDLDRAASLGSNCFRLSLEWSRLEPEQGRIDDDAVRRYHEMLDHMESKGMEPFVTLHHFVHPLWFERLGGFTKEENISLFVQYAETAFRLFGSRVKYWTTFNEPNVASFAGFIHGSFPPGRVASFEGCGRHMLHMLRAHTQAYNAIKVLPGGAASRIGLVWNWFWFEPKRACGGCCMPPYLPPLCRLLNATWGNQMLLSYLGAGEFDWQPSCLTTRVQWREPGGRPGCDYVGLNYYSRGVMDWKLAATCYGGEAMTDMPYALYPEGLSLAIHRLSSLKLPIYITETGVADRGDDLRAAMVQGYMAEVEKVVERGYDLRGVMYWSLTDNFEWALGFDMKFGIYAWENDGSQRRTLRPSGALLHRWFAELPARAAALWAQQRRRRAEREKEAAEDRELEEVLAAARQAPGRVLATS